jgi:hypothetical protein
MLKYMYQEKKEETQNERKSSKALWNSIMLYRNAEQKQKQSPYHTAMIVLTMERQK